MIQLSSNAHQRPRLLQMGLAALPDASGSGRILGPSQSNNWVPSSLMEGSPLSCPMAGRSTWSHGISEASQRPRELTIGYMCRASSLDQFSHVILSLLLHTLRRPVSVFGSSVRTLRYDVRSKGEGIERVLR
jgi:hypothetical protein